MTRSQFSEKLKRQLASWDKGTRNEREVMLRTFISSMQGRTEPQIEKEFNNGASLFLARVAAWLKLTHDTGVSTELQLDAIACFVSASSGHRFLLEFLEVDGLATILSVVVASRSRREAKIGAIALLTKICSAGRAFKDHIFELDGARILCEFAATMVDEEMHEMLRVLLLGMGRGNPEHVDKLQVGLLPLLTHEHARVQRTSSQVLRLLLNPRSAEGGTSASPHDDIIPAVRVMLAAENIHVQYDGMELARAAASHALFRPKIVCQLVDMLVPSRPDTPPKSEAGVMEPMTVVEREQMNAARLLGILSTDEDIRETVVESAQEHGVIYGLLVTMASAHKESKNYAAATLHSMMDTDAKASDGLARLVGTSFKDRWQSDRELGASIMTYDYLNSLLSQSGHQNLSYVKGASAGGRQLHGEDAANDDAGDGNSEPVQSEEELLDEQVANAVAESSEENNGQSTASDLPVEAEIVETEIAEKSTKDAPSAPVDTHSDPAAAQPDDPAKSAVRTERPSSSKRVEVTSTVP